MEGMVNTAIDFGNQPAFRALADPSRRAILMHLSGREMTIGEVAEHFTMTRAAVKKHLTILEEGKLISVHSRGRERVNRLEPANLKSAADWFDHFSQFWDERLTALKQAAENEKDRGNE
jgi:DNA-binding transcriptional ArsR family regulator